MTQESAAPAVETPVRAPDIVIEDLLAADAELDPPCNVLIHNDDFTPMDFVVAVLRAVFRLPTPEATRIMLQAHVTGVAHVVTLAREEAKYRVGQAHSIARSEGFPLTFTLEPA